MSQLIAQNAFRIVEGRPVTSSRIVAEYFNKRHDAVMRDVETLISKKPELKHLHNFVEMVETVEIGSGAKREVKVWMMDRKGFSILAMGFTGAKALDFKCAFYDEFERMEKQLSPSLPIDTLTPAQQLLVQQAVGRRAKRTASHYQTIYRAIKLRFQIAKYDQLPQSQLNECLKFIETVDLSVPEVVKHEQQMPTVHDNVMILSDKDLDRLRGFVYCYKYLFRKEVELFFSFLQGVRSPYAGKFYDSFTDWSLTNIEMMLEKAGYPIKTLDCYKHWEAHQKLERPF